MELAELLGAPSAETIVLDDCLPLASDLPSTDVEHDVREELPDVGGEEGPGCRPRSASQAGRIHRYFEADSLAPTAACPAARRAVSTLYGEQLT
jgi:hypothetical protein